MHTQRKHLMSLLKKKDDTITYVITECRKLAQKHKQTQQNSNNDTWEIVQTTPILPYKYII